MTLAEHIKRKFETNKRLQMVFLFDPDGAYLSEVEALDAGDFETVAWANNPFALKLRLNHPAEKKYRLVYLPVPEPATQEEYRNFHLLDLLSANHCLRLDDTATFMESYSLKPAQAALAGFFLPFLKFQAVQQFLNPILNPELFTRERLEKGIASYLLKCNAIKNSWDILLSRWLVIAGQMTSGEFQNLSKRLQEARLWQPMEQKMRDLFDLPGFKAEQASLIQLLNRLKYNLMMQQIAPIAGDPYLPFRIEHSLIQQRLYLFHEQVLSDDMYGSDLDSAMEKHATAIKEEELLKIYGHHAAYQYLTPELKWRILAVLFPLVTNASAEVTASIEKHNLLKDAHPEIQRLSQAVLQAAVCLQTIQACKNDNPLTPEEWIRSYTQSYYLIDLSYRRSVFRLQNVDDSEVFEGLNWKGLLQILNRSYNEWVEKMNRNWLQCLKSKQYDYRSIAVPKQYDFYDDEIAPFDQKAVVIISDGLRYEAAIELLSEMHQDSKSAADIQFRLASIPSKTSIGMSNLLPGGIRKFNIDAIELDGVATDSLPGREKVLRRYQPEARVVAFNDINRMSQEEARQLFKSPLVYVYHNEIDATGDKRESEYKTFRAVKDTIGELKKMVKKIHSSYNVSRVLITADHGFLYRDDAIADPDKEDAIAGANIQHNRFAYCEKPISISLGHILPLKATTRFLDDGWVIIPASLNRYKRQGSGHQYVHGGGSLQELVVPVIESARSREEITSKVNVKLLSAQLRIVSNVLKVELFQETNVNKLQKARQVKLAIYDGFEIVSAEKILELNSVSEQASERILVTSISLLTGMTISSALKLKVYDTDDTINPLIEQPVINQTLIQSDF